MDPQAVGLIGLAVFAVMLIIGVPVGIAMGLVGFAGFAFIVSPTAAIAKLAVIPFETMVDYNFAVVPAFILMAQIFSVSGFAGMLFDFCEKWLGHLRGGMGLATIAACAVFAAVSASTVATVVTIGLIAIPEMLKRRYDPRLAGACVAAAGGLGVLIPPSAVLILYGLMTQQSIRKLFMAGVIPGIILAVAYMITFVIICRMNPKIAPAGISYSFSVKIKSILGCGEAVALIALSLGGLFWGWFTPTEAGAVGATGAIVLGLIRRRLTWEGFKKSILATAANSGMVGVILVGALIFNYFAAVSTVPQKLVELAGGINASPFVIMLLVTGVYIILGCFMDSLSMIMLTVPFLYPLVLSLGYDPIWFGIYVVMVMEMAVITPPVGINVYTVAGIIEGMSLETVFRGVLPFVLTQVVVLLLFMLFPQIVLFLPNFLK